MHPPFERGQEHGGALCSLPTGKHPLRRSCARSGREMATTNGHEGVLQVDAICNTNRLLPGMPAVAGALLLRRHSLSRSGAWLQGGAPAMATVPFFLWRSCGWISSSKKRACSPYMILPHAPLPNSLTVLPCAHNNGKTCICVKGHV